MILCLINSQQYLTENIKLDYEDFDFKDYDEYQKVKKTLPEYLKYAPCDVHNLKERLEKDMLELGFISKNKMNEDGRYILPVYIQSEELEKKGITSYEDFLPNWSSLAYLNMLTKIKSYFLNYYEMNYSKGLEIDSMTLSLISLLDYDLLNPPLGIQKSIEKGKEVNGKCYFIDSIVLPTALPQETAMVLQSKDVLGVVTNLFKNRLQI